MSLTVDRLQGEDFNFTAKRYGIIGLVGERETGKTTFMVKKLVKEAITHAHYRKVYCDLHLGIKVDKQGLHYGYPDVQFITYEDFMQINDPSPKGIPTSLVGIDQIHRWFDARSSMSKHNIETSDKIVQSRQHGFDLITTTWGRGLVDNRLRKYYELLIASDRGRNGFIYNYIDPDQGPICRPKKIPWEMAKDIFRYFNTAEEVLPPRELEKLHRKGR